MHFIDSLCLHILHRLRIDLPLTIPVYKLNIA